MLIAYYFIVHYYIILSPQRTVYVALLVTLPDHRGQSAWSYHFIDYVLFWIGRRGQRARPSVTYRYNYTNAKHTSMLFSDTFHRRRWMDVHFDQCASRMRMPRLVGTLVSLKSKSLSGEWLLSSHSNLTQMQLWTWSSVLLECAPFVGAWDLLTNGVPIACAACVRCFTSLYPAGHFELMRNVMLEGTRAIIVGCEIFEDQRGIR